MLQYNTAFTSSEEKERKRKRKRKGGILIICENEGLHKSV